MLLSSQSRYYTAYTRHFIKANKRLLLPILLFLALVSPTTRDIAVQALSDAFFQVSIFVAATLLIYYYLVDRLPQLQLNYLRAQNPLLEVSFAALLGALPGCGGAIIVVTQFTKKQASFGSVVSVLVATMGDAAFLLLATQPLEALIIMTIGLVSGSACGAIVNAIHSTDYLQPKTAQHHTEHAQCEPSALKASKPIWLIVLLPSVVLALMLAMNVDFSQFGKRFETLVLLFGSAMALFTVSVWAFSSKGLSYQQIISEEEPCDPPSKLTKVLMDTHFVTAWVVASFMLFEILVSVFGLDLTVWFSEYAYLAPLIAVAIGLLPGCGPQIIVTTLYIQGVIPFSALAANAISNDGDALFPAIALAPRAALVATIYTTLPALAIGYGLYLFT